MKTNIDLVNYCKAQVGRPYWFGTFGLYPTEALWNSKAKQYSRYYTAGRKAKASAYFGAGAAKKCHDCIGLYKGFLWSDNADAEAKYNAKQDIDADGYFKRVADGKKGTIATLPEVAGLGLWRKGHFGVYIGNGKLIEAKGFDYGVVISEVAKSTFTNWCYLDEIEYVTSTKKPATPETATNAPTNASKEEMEVYTVKKNDTLYAIAKAHKTTVEQLVKDNGINDANLIKVGESLIINAPATSTPAPTVEPATPAKSYMRARVETNGSNLNIRETPNGSIIGGLANGTEFNYVSVSGKWVELAGGGGFVYVDFVKFFA